MSSDRTSPSALTFARLLGDGPLARVTLEATLGQLGAPAFIASERGTILHANAEGEKRASASRDAFRSKLRIAIQSLSDPTVVSEALVTPLRTEKSPLYYLVVFRPPCALEESVAYAGNLWELTPRQKAVLGLLAEGFSNKTIAVRLGCAERTIETHLTAIFQKSGFDGRSALLAALVKKGP